MVQKLSRLGWLAALALCLAAGHVPQDRGAALTVTKKETKLRTQKRALAPAVCGLVEGDQVKLRDKDGVWFSVEFKDKVGFIHSSDVTDKKDVRLSGVGVREVYTATEQSAARKGFNPQVEREYRDQNPNLEPAFRSVDEIQKKALPEAEIVEFLRAGRLGAEAGR